MGQVRQLDTFGRQDLDERKLLLKGRMGISDVLGALNISCAEQGSGPGSHTVFDCPHFHDHHAAQVRRDDQGYLCTTCHSTGDIFGLVMAVRHVGFVSAVALLEDLRGTAFDKCSHTRDLFQ